ncbi:Glucanosyltransferase-domain-containing protein [Clohesyomyces aquaticus]|uniref:1,3-beta-glucanosyltransferase n=1 Tax=Clohesyomyces aquaticus TaxID=1231657 RepID=A0A1Y1Y6S8_9PLEO|nr:Glucanosyltransferase-domain-containing protein [Clohesyomyces aquaticus]
MCSGISTTVLVFFSVILRSLLTVAIEVDPIVIKWSQFFFKSNGSEFFIRGINYQYFGVNGASSTEYIDPLSDKTICERDTPYLQRLSINVVRITYLDPTRDHTLCLNLLAAAGIYVITDLSGPTDRLSLEPRWDTNMLARYTSVVDALAGFTNVLAVSVGDLYFHSTYNDYIPFIKAAVRDIKKHIQDKKYRSIPVGYVTNTTFRSLSIDEMEYMTCDTPRVDFMGLRMTYSYYTNCTSDDDINHVATVFRDSTIPVFLDSWGCRVDPSNDNRTFEQIDTIYSNNVSRVLAGGIVEGYFQRTDPESNFGLVNAHYDTVDVTNGFRIFSSRIANASPVSTNINDYVPVNTASQDCSSKTSPSGVESTVLPPIPNKKLCSCMMGRSSMRCVAKEDGFDKMNATDQYYALKEICENKQDSCIGIYNIGSLGEYGAFRQVQSQGKMAFWSAKGR